MKLFKSSVGRWELFEKHMRLALVGIKHSGEGSSVKVNCPFCDDREMKGTLWHANTGRWWYSCWHASCEKSRGCAAYKWLSKVDPRMYEAWIDESRGHKTISPEMLQRFQMERERRIEEQKREHESRVAQDLAGMKYFKRISSRGRMQEAAIQFCTERRIPYSVWSKWWYADEGKYRDRLIIPFYNREGKIEFFQGRTLVNSEVKYLSRVGKAPIYNIDFIDRTKPVIAVEGPIDSTFLENSVALVGADSSAERDENLKGLNLRYIFDNDAAGWRASSRKVGESKYVFMWKKFLFDYNLPSDLKDVNDVILKSGFSKFSYADLEPYFTCSRDTYYAMELSSRGKKLEQFRFKRFARLLDGPEEEEIEPEDEFVD